MIRSAALAALAFAAVSGAHAGRPLVTEDADILERGSCELEGVAARERAAGAPTVKGWTTQLACGAGFDSQLALAYGRARADGASSSGWLLGGKTALVPHGDGATGLTLAWGATAEKAPGATLKHEATYLTLVATRTLIDGLIGHANLGWLRSESAKSTATTWNLAIEHGLGGGVDLVAELYGDDRTSEPVLGLGARWALTEQLQLNASWATQSGDPRVKLWTLGFKLAF